MKNKKATKTIATLESLKRERVRVRVCVRDLTYYVFARGLKKRHPGKLHFTFFFTKKVTCDNLFPPLRHSR